MSQSNSNMNDIEYVQFWIKNLKRQGLHQPARTLEAILIELSNARRKAKLLLTELDSLKNPEQNNTTGTFNLLNEVLKDAEELANKTITTVKAETPALIDRPYRRIKRKRPEPERKYELINNSLLMQQNSLIRDQLERLNKRRD